MSGCSQAAQEGRGEASRIGWAIITALPMSLMTLGGCVSYAQLLVNSSGSHLDTDQVVSAFNISIGAAVIAKNLMSFCPFMLSSADMTILLYLRHVIISLRDTEDLADEEYAPTMRVALHLASALLGGLFALLGMVRAAGALSYLPYPVVAGFLAMVGGAVVHGAIELLMPQEGQSWLPLIFGCTLACISTILKGGFNIPSNLSSVVSIVVSVIGFWVWAICSGYSNATLRDRGWLFPDRAQPVAPKELFWIDWQHVRWDHVFPDPDAGMLALIACIARALTVTSIEATLATTPYSIDEEMKNTGWATMLCGGIFGIAMNPASSMSALCSEGCQKDPRMALYTVLFSGTSFIGLWISGVPLTNYLPRFLLGALLMMMGIGLLVDWAWTVRHRVDREGCVIIYGMLGFSIKASLIHGVMLGLGLALVLTNLRFAGLEVLKYHVSGIHFRSGQEYLVEHRLQLARSGASTQVIGVTGFLFEGVANGLAKYLREVVRGLDGVEDATVVLDFFACQGINDSACAQLVKVAQLCDRNMVRFVLCNLHPTDVELLQSWNVESEMCSFAASVEQALRETEELLLANSSQPFRLIPTPAVKAAGPREMTNLASKEAKALEERQAVVRAALVAWLGEEAAAELLTLAEVDLISAESHVGASPEDRLGSKSFHGNTYESEVAVKDSLGPTPLADAAVPSARLYQRTPSKVGSIASIEASVDEVIIAVPGHSDVQLEVLTSSSSPAVLLRSQFGAVCNAEALVGGRQRGTWRTCADSLVLHAPPVEKLKSHPVAFQALLVASMQQHSVQMDQLSALYTVRSGGGWHGVTFDKQTRSGISPDILPPKMRRVSSPPAVRPSTGADLPTRAPPDGLIQRSISDVQSPRPGSVLQAGGANHLIAAVLTSREDREALSPKGSPLPRRVMFDDFESSFMGPSQSLLNRVSVGEDLCALGDDEDGPIRRFPKAKRNVDWLLSSGEPADQPLAMPPSAIPLPSPAGGRKKIAPDASSDERELLIPEAVARQSRSISSLSVDVLAMLYTDEDNNPLHTAKKR